MRLASVLTILLIAPAPPPATGSDRPTAKAKVEERLLGRLNGAKAQLEPLYIGEPFSPDGRLAYVARDAKGEYAVVDGVSGPRFDAVGELVFSARGDRLAYVATVDDWDYLVVDGERGPGFEGITDLAWSPTGRLAYIARDLDGRFAVVDGVRGPTFDFVEQLAWAGVGERLAYSATSEGREFIVVDGERGPVFDQAGEIAWSDDGRRLAYRAWEAGKQLIVLDGRRSEAYDKIRGFTLGPGGRRLAVLAEERGRRRFVVVDGEAGPRHEIVRGIRFSPDGQELAYSYGDRERQWLRHGSHVHGPHPWIGAPVYSPDGARVAFTVTRGERPNQETFVVVEDEPVAPSFTRVRGLTFSPDGSRVAYQARVGEGEWRVVVDDRPGPSFDYVWPPSFTPDGTGVVYRALRGVEVFEVTARPRMPPTQVAAQAGSPISIDFVTPLFSEESLTYPESTFSSPRSFIVFDPVVFGDPEAFENRTVVQALEADINLARRLLGLAPDQEIPADAHDDRSFRELLDELGGGRYAIRISGTVYDELANLVPHNLADIQSVTLLTESGPDLTVPVERVGRDEYSTVEPNEIIELMRSFPEEYSHEMPFPFVGRFQTETIEMQLSGGINSLGLTVTNAANRTYGASVQVSRAESEAGDGGPLEVELESSDLDPGMTNPVFVFINDDSVNEANVADAFATVNGHRAGLKIVGGRLQLEWPLLAFAHTPPDGAPNVVQVGNPESIDYFLIEYRGVTRRFDWSYSR